MTTAPQQHCDHERICFDDVEACAPCDNDECGFDTRSRPHTPTPKTCKKYWMYRSHSGHLYHLLFDLLGREFPEDESLLADALMEVRDNQTKHDATIRNATLDELYNWLDEKVDPDEAMMRILTIGKKIKSLRGKP